MNDTWQDRLIQEGEELAGRLDKLKAFWATDRCSLLPAKDIELLKEQQFTMQKYLDILNERIARTQPKRGKDGQPA